MNDILTHEPILVNTGPGAFIVADPPTPLERILATANDQGRYFRGGPIPKMKGPEGVLWIRETRGYIVLEVWHGNLPGMLSHTVLMWDFPNQRWVTRTTEARVNAWLAEAEAAMGGLDNEDGEIPFDGRPAAPRRAVSPADEYGLEARG